MAPHEDDLIVVLLMIVGYDTKRVLLDQGSSTDVIYGDAFKKLKLDPAKLKPYNGSLVGFAGEKVMVRGWLELETIFGMGENIKRVQVKYLAISFISSYNVIIGRRTMNKIATCISTAHLTVKYPLSNGLSRSIRPQREGVMRKA